MNRSVLLMAALLVAPACDGDKAKPAGDKTASAKTTDKAKTDKAPEAKDKAPEAKADPWKAKLDSRVLAQSGLDVGGKLSAFDIINCESGEKYCQVCRFGGNPKIMAVGTADDEAFQKDLQDLDAIVKKYGEDKIKAFAVITDLQQGKAKTPADAQAAKDKANELKKKLNISMPVVVPAPEDGGGNRVWDEYYNITASRTVMFADGRNEVKFSAIGPDDWSKLNDSIQQVVGTKAG